MRIKVGIFWTIGGKVYPYIEERETNKLNAREKLSGKIDSDYEHFTAWDKELSKKFPTADFATFPRGRVMFDIKENRHIVYADKHVTETELDMIKRLFVTVSPILCGDDHYRCDNCMKNELPKLYVREFEDCYKVVLDIHEQIIKRTLPKNDEKLAECGLEDIAFYLDTSKPTCKFSVDELPSSAFSVFFANHTGIVPRYIIKDKIFYKILDGENKIGANLIAISCNNKNYLIECGEELQPTESGTKLREKIIVRHYDACFVTHCHGDHAGLLNRKINCDRIYMGEATFKILNAINGICAENMQKVITFTREQNIELYGMTVTPYLCDHSAYDSYMLYFKSRKNSILYTGDFRSHGRKSYSALLKKLPHKVDTLICEGTNVGSNMSRLSERDLENKLVELCRNDKPVFVLQSATNIDRFVSVYRAAVRSNRIFIMRLAQADICSKLPNIPQPNGFKKCFAYPEFPLTDEQYIKYSEKYGKRLIGKERISKIDKYILEVTSKDLFYIQKLAQSGDLRGAKLIYSTWSGYKEREDMKTFLCGVKNLGIDIIDLHASGHADIKTIEALRQTVKSDEFIQVHKPPET